MNKQANNNNNEQLKKTNKKFWQPRGGGIWGDKVISKDKMSKVDAIFLCLTDGYKWGTWMDI